MNNRYDIPQTDIRNLIFDLDDTLLNCSCHYEEVKSEFIEAAHERTTIHPGQIRELLNAIDSTNGQLHHFTKERWPLSFAATSAVLDTINGRDVDRAATQEAYDIGNKVFDCAYPPIPGAIETLEKYHNAGFNLILYTKGDQGVQKKKLASNGLWKYFPGANIYIVNKKNGDAIRKIINEQYILPIETMVIGDNIREDVESALDAKISPVHIDPRVSPGTVDINIKSLTYHYWMINSVADLPLLIPTKSMIANV